MLSCCVCFCIFLYALLAAHFPPPSRDSLNDTCRLHPCNLLRNDENHLHVAPFCGTCFKRLQKICRRLVIFLCKSLVLGVQGCLRGFANVCSVLGKEQIDGKRKPGTSHAPSSVPPHWVCWCKMMEAEAANFWCGWSNPVLGELATIQNDPQLQPQKFPPLTRNIKKEIKII